MQNMSSIVVAIDCITYNHELYIRDCLEGFVMQKTNFKFVAIVHDDASTDGTATIIKEYAEKYPDIIKPILETENQYSKKDGSLQRIMSNAIEATGAKYVAMCEGDDYWIDPYKLQKQVDFMEANEQYSLCFTNSNVKYDDCEYIAINNVWDSYAIDDIINSNALNQSERGDRVVSCAHTSTVLYRRPFSSIPSWVSKCFIGDEPLFIFLAHKGKAKFINNITSVYRAGVGVSSRNFNYEEDWKNRIKMYNIIDNGLQYKYHKLINPIIAEFEYKLFKLLWKNGNKIKSLKYFCLVLMKDYRIILNQLKK